MNARDQILALDPSVTFVVSTAACGTRVVIHWTAAGGRSGVAEGPDYQSAMADVLECVRAAPEIPGGGMRVLSFTGPEIPPEPSDEPAPAKSERPFWDGSWFFGDTYFNG